MTGKFVFAPLFLATFIAILLSPIVGYLEGKGIWSSLSSFLTVLGIFLLVAGIGLAIGVQYNEMLEELPEFHLSLSEYVAQAQEFLQTKLRISENYLDKSFSNLKLEAQGQAGEVVGTLFFSVSSVISFMLLVPVFTFLILYYRNTLKDFIKELSEQYPRVTFTRWMQTLTEIQGVVRNYLVGLLFVTMILAVLNSIGLWVLGLPYPFLLGISAAVFSIIPYIGNLVGGGIAAGIGLATGTPFTALAVVVLFGVIQTIEGNLVTPMVMDNQVGVNPLVVILALLIGGYVWGIIGMIVSVPIVAIIKVLFDKKEELQPFATLIEGHE